MGEDVARLWGRCEILPRVASIKTSMVELFEQWWPSLAAILSASASLGTSVHAILIKRDVRAAVAWAGICWLVPLVGPVLYLLLGVNRIERRASQLMAADDDTQRGGRGRPGARAASSPTDAPLPESAAHLEPLVRLVGEVVRHPLLPGNDVRSLVDGDEAYPAMLTAIESAERSVCLSTYIFDNDETGNTFVDALAGAVERGVEVRVLIDAVGARYSLPSIVRVLRRRNVPCARFLHSIWPWRMPYFNLRNHRKLLIVDAAMGFTGGMNIRDGHMRSLNCRAPIQDLHFEITGPVVGQLMRVFAEDWSFTTGEKLHGDAWRTAERETGSVAARAIPDGPDIDMDNLHWAILGALAEAKSSVRVATPYFLPDQALITALNLASMRGVDVEILIPAVNNFRIVDWAATHQLPQLLQRGCRVIKTPGPFDHSKAMVVDDVWTLIGSANWDARSLRLNFELNVECYDARFAARVTELLDDKAGRGVELTVEELVGRHPILKLRDGIARLALPYL